MKKAISNFKASFQALWNDESAQGATEYILLLVVVVGLALAFKPKITAMLNSKMDDISGKVGSFNTDN